MRQGNIIFDDTYLDIIAAAEVNVATEADSSRKKKYLDELKKDQQRHRDRPAGAFLSEAGQPGKIRI